MVKEEVIISCPHCKSENVYRNGKDKHGKQKYQCQQLDCGKNFITEYSRNGCKIEVQEQIITMAMNGSGVRDTSRVLNISPVTVIKKLRSKLSEIKQVNEAALSCQQCEIEIEEVQADEKWSYVKQKSDQQWLWYGIDSKDGKVLAWHIGKRDDASLIKLLQLLKKFKINTFHTDGLDCYQRHIPAEKHIVSKINMQKIERKNLTLRTRIKRLARKTICYSKATDMHFIVIGLFINLYLFNPI